MGAMASQNTGLSIVYLTACSSADQWKHQSSASLAFVRGIHQWPLNSPHKGTVTRKMFPFDYVIMIKKSVMPQTRIETDGRTQATTITPGHIDWGVKCNRTIPQITQCIWQICYKIVYSGIWDWCIVRSVWQVNSAVALTSIAAPTSVYVYMHTFSLCFCCAVLSVHSRLTWRIYPHSLADLFANTD